MKDRYFYFEDITELTKLVKKLIPDVNCESMNFDYIIVWSAFFTSRDKRKKVQFSNGLFTIFINEEPYTIEKDEKGNPTLVKIP